MASEGGSCQSRVVSGEESSRCRADHPEAFALCQAHTRLALLRVLIALSRAAFKVFDDGIQRVQVLIREMRVEVSLRTNGS